jgi:DNA-binding transcriptional ArsR family regulator
MADAATEELQAFKAAFFKALAHPVRIRILELLVKGDKNVQELQDALGAEQPVVSQQLAVLRASNIVAGRKEGASVRYSVRDPLIGELLNTARRIFNNHLVGTQDLLRQLQYERRRR